MAGVIADSSLTGWLNTGLRNVSTNWLNAKLHLFKNNVTPDNNSVVSTFTEANFAGYAAQTFATTDWSAASLTAHVASIISSAKNFTITAGTQDVYGWYVTDSAGTTLLASQRDPAAPITLDASAVNTLSLILTVQLKDIATP